MRSLQTGLGFCSGRLSIEEMSISGVSDILDAPDGLDSLDDDGLAEDLIEEQDDDSALLDAALGDVSTLDKPSATPTPTEEPAEETGDSILDETNDSVQEEDPEIEAIKARVKEMEEEAEKLKEMQGEVEKQMMTTTKSQNAFPTVEEKQEADQRSVYVGNVDYQSTAEELGQHFQSCGAINRVTILCDRYTGNPKGFAYVEFVDKSSVTQAVELDDSLFKGRQIKVGAKRTNRPGLTTTNRGARGRGRGRGFRGVSGYNPYMGGMMMMPMPAMGYYRGGRGRPFRGRAKTSWYAPY